MSIVKNLPELVNAGVINQDTADRIRNYYEGDEPPSTNRLIIIFGILGALLIGLGIILIVAHNWDDMPRLTKAIISFIPLVVGQGLAAYTLIKNPDSIAMRESTTTFLFCAVGASIALISQIYNIPGALDSFLFTWLLLCLPLTYIMNSSLSSILCLGGIAWLGMENGWDSVKHWPLFLAALPFYYKLYREKPESNFMILHNWVVPIVLLFLLATIDRQHGEILSIGYVSLLGVFYLLGDLPYFKQQKLRNNSYLVIGALGTLIIMLTLSFDFFWEGLRSEHINMDGAIVSGEFAISMLITLLGGWLLYGRWKQRAIEPLKLTESTFVIFFFIFFIGLYYPVAVVLINLLLLALGVLTIRVGVNKNHLGIVNYGLLIVTALVICRFFDSNITFVIRGLLFLVVGVGFFAVNYMMLKKKKDHG